MSLRWNTESWVIIAQCFEHWQPKLVTWVRFPVNYQFFPVFHKLATAWVYVYVCICIVTHLAYSFHYTARPIAPGSDSDNSVCTYQQLNSQYCLFRALINVTNVLNNNKDTEVSYVSLRALGEGEISHIIFSISPTTQVCTLNTTFHCSSPNIPFGINMSLTVIDKCGQQSETVTQQCMRLNSEPQGI